MKSKYKVDKTGNWSTPKNEIEGGLADGESLGAIAQQHGVSVQDIVHQCQMGVKVEKEHTKSESKAKEIAMDHLKEHPYYYTRLAMMEHMATLDKKRPIPPKGEQLKDTRLGIFENYAEGQYKSLDHFVQDLWKMVTHSTSKFKGGHVATMDNRSGNITVSKDGQVSATYRQGKLSGVGKVSDEDMGHIKAGVDFLTNRKKKKDTEAGNKPTGLTGRARDAKLRELQTLRASLSTVLKDALVKSDMSYEKLEKGYVLGSKKDNNVTEYGDGDKRTVGLNVPKTSKNVQSYVKATEGFDEKTHGHASKIHGFLENQATDNGNEDQAKHHGALKTYHANRSGSGEKKGKVDGNHFLHSGHKAWGNKEASMEAMDVDYESLEKADTKENKVAKSFDEMVAEKIEKDDFRQFDVSAMNSNPNIAARVQKAMPEGDDLEKGSKDMKGVAAHGQPGSKKLEENNDQPAKFGGQGQKAKTVGANAQDGDGGEWDGEGEKKKKDKKKDGDKSAMGAAAKKDKSSNMKNAPANGGIPGIRKSLMEATQHLTDAATDEVSKACKYGMSRKKKKAKKSEAKG